MLKKENMVWLYFIGILVLLVIVFFVARDYVIPVLTGQRNTVIIDNSLVFTAPPAMTIDKNRDYKAIVTTDLGSFTIELYEKFAPTNVNNFVFLANRNYYNGTYVHRLVPGLFFQMGDRHTLNSDPADDGFGGPGYIIADEINWDALQLSDTRRQVLASGGYKSIAGVFSQPLKQYSVAMASSGPDTNGSQFFIVTSATTDPRLAEMSGKFTTIGEVVGGREVISRIDQIEVDASNSLVPRPIQKVKIKNIRITN